MPQNNPFETYAGSNIVGGLATYAGGVQDPGAYNAARVRTPISLLGQRVPVWLKNTMQLPSSLINQSKYGASGAQGAGGSSMKLGTIVVIGALLAGLLAFGQSDNTLHVKEFPGATVGAKVAAAQAACPSNGAPCIIVIDASLASFTSGTLPAKCALCSWVDYRQGSPINPAGVIHVGTMGGDIATQVNAALAGCAGGCYIHVDPGAYSTAGTILVPLQSLGKITLEFDKAAIVTYTGSGYFIDTQETGAVGSSSGVTIKGGYIYGTSAAAGLIRLLPQNDYEVSGMHLLDASSGDGILCNGCEASVFGPLNFIQGNNYGMRLNAVGCRTTAPYDCSAAYNGAGFSLYAATALRINRNIIAANVTDGIYDQKSETPPTASLNVTVRDNDLEQNDLRIDLSYGPTIDKNYFEGGAHFIVLGTASTMVFGASVTNNHFTAPNTSGFTIENVYAQNTNAQGNVEFAGANTCFFNIGWQESAFVVGNVVTSTNQLCSNGTPTTNPHAGMIYTEGATNILHVPAMDLDPSAGVAGLTLNGLAIMGSQITGSIGTGPYIPTAQSLTSKIAAFDSGGTLNNGGTGTAGQATCWKTSGSIGYCSTVVSSTGGCTCN